MSVQLVAVSRKMAAAGGRLCFCHSQGRKPLHRLHSMLLMKCRQRDINGDIRKCELFTHFAQATPCDRKWNQRAVYCSAEPSRDRVTTLPFTPMESSPLHRLLLNRDNEWGQAEVRECIGVYGRALVHEPRDRAVLWSIDVATLLSRLW